jgi:hypothetical protein
MIAYGRLFFSKKLEKEKIEKVFAFSILMEWFTGGLVYFALVG